MDRTPPVLAESSSSSRIHHGVGHNVEKEQDRIGLLYRPDVSIFSRNSSVRDSSRLSANTHHSILNLNEEEDDDDADEDDEFVHRNVHLDNVNLPYTMNTDSAAQDEDNDDLRSTATTDNFSASCCAGPQAPLQRCCGVTRDSLNALRAQTFGASSIFGTTRAPTLLEFVTQRLESLCFPSHDQQTLTPLRDPGNGAARNGANTATTPSWVNYRLSLEYDVLQLLGCATPPDTDELERVWGKSSRDSPFHASPSNHIIAEPPRARKLSSHERAAKVRHIVNSRCRNKTRTTVVSPTSIVGPIPRARSLDPTMISAKHSQTTFLPKLEPIQDGTDVGYDSDPEIRMGWHSAASDTFLIKPQFETDNQIYTTVQETFNLVWSLLLHDSSGNPPQTIAAWMERGTMVHGSKMVEPSLMWRIETPSRSKTLPTLATHPAQLRLLNICRVLTPAHSIPNHPLVRVKHAILLKTTSPSNEETSTWVLEAANQAERDDIVRRWKATIARFASLAVLEDMDIMLQEFVHDSPPGTP
jgi:hypothetical protein